MNVEVQLIKDISYKPKASQLGVIIKRPEPSQSHTGFIFIDKDSFVLAHFGWHETYFFQRRIDSDGYAMFWFDLEKVPERTLVQIINELEQITQNQNLHKNEIFIFLHLMEF